MTVSAAIKTQTAVIIPAYNEAATIAEVIAHLQQHEFRHIFVIDDASSDRTRAIAEGCGAMVIGLSVQLGAWGAMQTGLRYAQRHGFTYAVTLDADGQHDARFVENLIHVLIDGESEVAIGSQPTRVSRLRRIAWGYFRTLTRLTVQDLTSGFRGYSKKSLKLVTNPTASLLDYQDVGVLMLLQKWRLPMREVSVQMHHRQHGKSRIFRSWFMVAIYMLKNTTICLAKRNS